MTKLQLLHLPHRKAQAWGRIVCLVFLWKDVFRVFHVAGVSWLERIVLLHKVRYEYPATKKSPC